MYAYFFKTLFSSSWVNPGWFFYCGTGSGSTGSSGGWLALIGGMVFVPKTFHHTHEKRLPMPLKLHVFFLTEHPREPQRRRHGNAAQGKFTGCPAFAHESINLVQNQWKFWGISRFVTFAEMFWGRSACSSRDADVGRSLVSRDVDGDGWNKWRETETERGTLRVAMATTADGSH